MKAMPYKIKQKLRQYAKIQEKAKNIQREVENMIEEYGVPIENLIACGDTGWDTPPQTEALAFLNNGECDDIEGTIKEIEDIFLYFVNNDGVNYEQRKIFLKPERPFLLIYTDNDEISYAWLETEEELKEVIAEVKSYGCEISDAIEIGSCRDVIFEEG